MKKDCPCKIMDVQISGWTNFIYHSKWHLLQIYFFLKFHSRISQFVLIFPHPTENFQNRRTDKMKKPFFSFRIMRESVPQWWFGLFHVVQNEFLEFKIFKNSIDRLKALQEKPSPLFGFSKIQTWKKTTFSFPSYFIFCFQNRKKKSPSAVSILSGFFLYFRFFIGQ